MHHFEKDEVAHIRVIRVLEKHANAATKLREGNWLT
jgi:hypothetical protein